MSTNSNYRRPKKQKRMFPRVAVILLLMIVLLIAVAAGGVYYLLKIYNPTPDTNPDLIPVDSGIVTTDENGNIDPDDYRKKDENGKNSFFTFLLLGKDVAGYNTDVFMLASFDVTNHTISIMQIPRDTYFERDDSHYKINALYAHERNKARRAATGDLTENDLIHAGMTGVRDALSEAMRINIDYYAIMDLQGFRNIVDCIGGVYMYVPRDMEYADPEQDLYINLKQGWQTLDGKKAEQFVRFRKGYKLGDVSRVEAQKLFMTAMIDQVKKSLSVTTVAGIAEQAWQYLDTSMSTADLIYFAKEFFSVSNDKIIMLTCPGEATYVGQASYYVVHRADLLNMVNRYFNVFRTDVTDAKFDPNHAFVSETDQEVMDIYQKPLSETDNAHSAQDIENNGLILR